MRFAVLTLFLPVPALAAQDNEAEKLFKQLEKTLVQAKALKVVGELDVGDEKTKMKLSVLVADRKLRLEIHAERGDKRFTVEAVSDGKTLKTRASTAEKVNEEPAAKNLAAAARQMVGRFGLASLTFGLGRKPDEEPKEINVEELFRPSNFQMGKAEKVNGRATRVITYKVTVKGDKDPAVVTLWLDAKTLLPLKHRIETDDGKHRITSTYTTFDLKPKVDPKTFELPK